MHHCHRFGGVEVRPVERQLLVDGQSANVGSRAFELLLMLIDERHRVVTKEEILDRVWPGLVVEEANVQVQVSALRKVIGRESIATIPGRGYRFSASVHEAVAEPDSAPSPMTSVAALPELIGRELDQQALEALLADHRLVTVIGPGGIGKTRLAQAVAAKVAARHPDGVRWVDLASLTSASQVAPAVARATGVDIAQGNDNLRLAHCLAHRHMLLVLDNCEHLADETARLAGTVLANSSGMHVLATSQEPLRIADEQRYRLDCLAIPPSNTRLGPARAFGALQLLENRLRAADRHFQLDEHNVGAAIELCRHLDGNALAIEMAAARVPVLGLGGVIARLGERLRLLSTARRDAPMRQQSLRAMLEWSHGLLSQDEQTVLRRLSTFVGTFSLEVAQSVAADDSLDHWTVVEAVAALADKSLVQVEGVESTRYRLLESVKAVAAERLDAEGEAPSTRRRNGSAYAALAERALSEFWAMPDDAWLQRYGPDRDDLEAAFDNACQRSDAVVGARIVGLLCRLDDTRSVSANVRARKEAVRLLLPHADALARARLWTCLTWHPGIAIAAVPRRAAALEAVAAWRELGDPRELYLALWRLAVECANAEGEASGARMAMEEAQALEVPIWPARLRWMGAHGANDVASLLGERHHYRERFEAALAVAEQAGSLRCIVRTRLNFADHALMAGDIEEAVALGKVVIEELRSLDQPAALGWALSNLCAAQLAAGEFDASRSAAVEALPLMWAHGWGTDLLNHVALIAARQGRYAESAMVLGYVEAAYSASQDAPLINEARLAEEATRLALVALGSAGIECLRAKGAGLSGQEVELLARSLINT